ncbi:carbohydrate-binding protein [Citrobacter braakii]
MSKIARYQGNVRAFASDAQGMERTVFGGTNQADDLTSQITASFLRGWGIVGASEHPSLEDFNAAMYAMSQFIAYQHQMGVPEWHAQQEYHIGSICTHNGESYQSLQDANVGSPPPSAKWTPVLTSKNGLANLGFSYSNNLYKFPGRQMTQRGSSITNAAGATTITFPQAYTGNVVVVLSGSDSNGVTIATLNGLPTNTGFSVTTKIAGGAYAPLNFCWIAWGDY